MAREFTISASIEYDDSTNEAFTIGISEIEDDITTKDYVRHSQQVGVTEEALDLGGLATLGWAVFINRDDTNFVEIRSGTGAGNDIIKIPPGMIALFHFGSDITAPFAIANTATVRLEYCIWAQ